jgi:hypothetical protein
VHVECEVILLLRRALQHYVLAQPPVSGCGVEGLGAGFRADAGLTVQGLVLRGER